MFAELDVVNKKENEKTRKQEDTPWKEILDHHLKDFLMLCCPDIAADIDWKKGYESLDHELHAIARDHQEGNRLVDKLVKVWRKNGLETWVLLHIELQGKPERRFEERLYIYHYRLFDKYKKPIVTIAILTDDNSKWRPTAYYQSLWGCQLELQFRTVKLLDYKTQHEILEKSNNIFATIILACLVAMETKKNVQTRFQQKLAFTRRLYERGFNKKQISNLYKFIDFVMALPKDLELKYHQVLVEMEEEKRMSYVTTAERIGIEKGKHQGRGVFLYQLLQQKFGSLTSAYLEKIEAADADTLLIWGARLLSANNLDEIFKD